MRFTVKASATVLSAVMSSGLLDRNKLDQDLLDHDVNEGDLNETWTDELSHSVVASLADGPACWHFLPRRTGAVSESPHRRYRDARLQAASIILEAEYYVAVAASPRDLVARQATRIWDRS